jgi:hypothetical protein
MIFVKTENVILRALKQRPFFLPFEQSENGDL